jgi:perosamine synthetase
VVTDSEEIAAAARSLRNQGRGEMGAWLLHERLGFNYRMDEMSAALGVSQVDRIETFLERREQVAVMYTERVREMSGVRAPVVRPEVRMSWFVYVVTLHEGIDRDRVMREMQGRGIPVRGYFPPVHLQPYIRAHCDVEDVELPMTESVSRRTIALPFHNNITEDEVEYVIRALDVAIESSRRG